ncbi:hypothetical protein D3C76_404250 [compost metagenome]
MALVGEYPAVAVRVADGDIGQARVTRQGEGAVIADSIAGRVAVHGGHPRLELHGALVLGARRHGIAEQRTAGADHVQARLGHLQGGEGVGRVQGQLAAVELGMLDQPVGLLVERCQALAYIVLVFHSEVGHQCHQLQVLLVGDLQRFTAPAPTGHLYPVAAHAAGIERQVNTQGLAMALGDGVSLAGKFGAADQFFHVVLQGIFQLAQAGQAHPHQLPGKAAGPHHAGFLVAGHRHAGHAKGNDRGHHQADAVAVGIGLEHGAQLGLATQLRLQGADVVLQGACADLDPGIAVLHGQGVAAVVHRQRWCGIQRGLAGDQQGQGSSQKRAAKWHGGFSCHG